MPLLARIFTPRGSLGQITRCTVRRFPGKRPVPQFEWLEDRTLLSGWTVTATGDVDDPCFEIDLDAAGNIYISGSFGGSMTMGSETLTSEGSNWDLFVAKVDSAGNVAWVKSFGNDPYWSNS